MNYNDSGQPFDLFQSHHKNNFCGFKWNVSTAIENILTTLNTDV